MFYKVGSNFVDCFDEDGIVIENLQLDDDY